MKSLVLRGIALVSLVALPGCDNMLSIDNWDRPDAMLSGNLVFNGQPVGVRVNGVNLQLWQIEPEYPLETALPVRVDQSGRFSAAIFDGTYEINLVPGNGPWVDDPTRRTVVVRGATSFDIPVQPYYTVQNPQITYNPNPAPGGSITATFNVGQHNTSRALEWVGVYVGTTTFVDRSNGLPISNAIRERSRTAIQNTLNQNGTVSITVNLPSDIHLTPSPDRRNDVFVRVGVKTVGVSEMLFTPVHKVGI
jgi:hypothetical protein